MFVRSTNCGETWSTPISIAPGTRLNQNAQIAIEPTSGAIYVSWRAFKSGTQGDGIFVAKSTNAGASFGKPVRVAPIYPYDQGTSLTSFRSNGFQTMAIDATGRVYIAWSERGHATLRPDASPATRASSCRRRRRERRGRCLRRFARRPRARSDAGAVVPGGRLRMVYYDLREDISQIFGHYIDEAPILGAPDPKPLRHTLDVYVRAGRARRGTEVHRGSAVGLCERLPAWIGHPPATAVQSAQSAVVPPGHRAVHGGLPRSRARAGIRAGRERSVGLQHATDRQRRRARVLDRQSRRPAAGRRQLAELHAGDVGLAAERSIFDPNQIAPSCVAGHTGMRNQNVYTARVTQGLFVGSPGNTKPLEQSSARSWSRSRTRDPAPHSYRLTIANQPPGGNASFLQFVTGAAP